MSSFGHRRSNVPDEGPRVRVKMEHSRVCSWHTLCSQDLGTFLVALLNVFVSNTSGVVCGRSSQVDWGAVRALSSVPQKRTEHASTSPATEQSSVPMM